MISKNNHQNKIFIVMTLATISFMILDSSVIGISDARKMSPYSCKPNNDGPMGPTKCCAVDLDTLINWCTSIRQC